MADTRFGPNCRTFEPPDLEPQLAPAGVTHTVLVQAADSYADTEYMLEQAALYPWIIGVVGSVPLLLPDVAARGPSSGSGRTRTSAAFAI